MLGTTALALLIASVSVKAEVVGAVTALQTNINKAGGRDVAVGSAISLGDKLTSNRTGLGMIVFNDESSAKIGPNSQLTIDEFVYSPGRSNGAISVNMKSGLVRFYGGQISKSGTMQITTPHIVLGVRGGILDTLVKDGVTKSMLRAGQMFCSVNGRTKTVTKPGFSCLSDGTTLRIETGIIEEMALLDSQDRIAGNGIPGRIGTGLRARSACIAGTSDSSERCKSEDGSLPGIGSITRSLRNRLPALGSNEDPIAETTVIDCSIYGEYSGASIVESAAAGVATGITTGGIIPFECQ